MPPDIKTGPLALGVTPAPPISAAGTGPPGSDPFAGLFAALLARGGPLVPLGAPRAKPEATLSTQTPKGVKAGDPEVDTLKKDTPRKDKAVAESTIGSAVSGLGSAALNLLSPPISLPISLLLNMTGPPTPPTAGVTVGQKTMDTFPMPVPLTRGAAGKTGGELPLQQSGPGTQPSPANPFPVTFTTPLLGSVPAPRLALLSPVVLPPTVPVQSAVSPGVSPGATSSGAIGRVVTPPTGNQTEMLATDRLASQDVPTPASVPVQVTTLGAQQSVTAALPPAALPPVALGVPAAKQETEAQQTQWFSPDANRVPVAQNASVAGTVSAIMPSTDVQAGPLLVQAAVQASARPLISAQSGVAASPTLPAVSVPSMGSSRVAQALATTAQASGILPVLLKPTEPVTAAATRPAEVLAAAAAESNVPAAVLPTAPQGRPRFAPAKQTPIPEIGLKTAGLPADNNTRTQQISAKQTTAAEALVRSNTGSVRAGRHPEETDISSGLLPAPATVMSAETTLVKAAPLTAADRAEVVKQAAEGVGAMPLPNKPGATEQMTLQLHPKDWGRLQVSVTIAPGPSSSAVQTVTAHIVAASPQIKAALESGSGDLRHSLREAGLHLDKMTITVQSAGTTEQAAPASKSAHPGADQGTSGGAFSQPGPDRKAPDPTMTRTSADPNSADVGSGTGSFAASAGNPQGGRQGNPAPPPLAYQAADSEEMFEAQAPRRLPLGQVDMRA